mmetsp:Transcript_5501/g.13146  ORF Transcript_5501/g.13146 Transcript_5501/m.13146 type:complete len:213 (-) Transcript_5501:1821-2459(-)
MLFSACSLIGRQMRINPVLRILGLWAMFALSAVQDASAQDRCLSPDGASCPRGAGWAGCADTMVWGMHCTACWSFCKISLPVSPQGAVLATEQQAASELDLADVEIMFVNAPQQVLFEIAQVESRRWGAVERFGSPFQVSRFGPSDQGAWRQRAHGEPGISKCLDSRGVSEPEYSKFSDVAPGAHGGRGVGVGEASRRGTPRPIASPEKWGR